MTPPPAPVLELEAPATEPIAPPKKRRGRPPLPKERPTSQINARIDSELKTQGDAALERAGFSPTAAIRALWTLAIQLDNQPGALAAILDPDRDKPTEEQLAERARKVKLARAGVRIFDDYLLSHGIDPASVPVNTNPEESYEEALEELLYERLVERGLDR